MKKIALFALAALCSAAAQALTLDWDKTGTKGFDLASATGDITLTVSVVGGASIPYYGSAADTCVFELAGIKLTSRSNNATDSNGYIYFGGDDRVTSGDHTSNTRLQGGTTTYTFVFSGYDATTQTWDRLDASVVWANTNKSPEFYNGAVNLSIEDLQGTGFSSDFDDITLDSATLSGEGVVPEPTALALLALGVAGLALKRKNA